MGRAGSLTADPLRFAGAGAAGLALRRLDRGAAGAVPVRFAGRALAPLTCLRLESLLEPLRGDEALAAALARYGEKEPAEAVGGDLQSAKPMAHRGRAAARERTAPAPAEARRSAPMTRAPENAQLALPPQPRLTRREAPAAGGRDAVAPRSVRTPQSVRAVEGLEWLVDRMPGGRETIDRPLELAAPRVRVEPPPEKHRRARSQASAHDETRGEAPREPGRVEPLRSIATAKPQPNEPLRTFEPESESARGVRAAPAGDQGLAALVRAWNGQSEQPDVEGGTADAPALALEVSGEAVPADVPPPPRSRRQEALSPEQAVAAEELLGLGDELGRVLVAELRRYGIEVGA